MTEIQIPYSLVARESYLSGDVRQKLRKAKRAAVANPLFDGNVQALEQVMPDRVPLEEVVIAPGATWIPVPDYEQFCIDVLRVQVTIFRSDVTSHWAVRLDSQYQSAANEQTYGMSWSDYTYHGNSIVRSLTGVQLFEKLLNGKKPVIRIRSSDGESSYKDPSQTANAIAKQAQLKQAFIEWCLIDESRKQRLESLYNAQCNNINLRTYDGSALRLHMAPKWLAYVQDRPYQLDGIYRGIVGNYLDDHMSALGIFWQMGLGKTITAIAIACERVLARTANRAMIVVKKQTLDGFAQTLQEAYPQIKVMVATEADLTESKRQLFLAAMVYDDPQVVVVSHEQFAKLSLRVATEKQFIQERLDMIRADISAQIESGADPKAANGIVKRIERARNRLEAKREKLRNKRDKGFCFEDLGIDFLLFDEFDVVKNGWFYTKMDRVAGISRTVSSRADDFDVKHWWMAHQYGTGRMVALTGTPVSNSLVELWRLFMQLAPRQMELRGWHQFDFWAAVCGNIKTGAAIKGNGQLEQESRFCEFVNLVEQLRLLHAVADIKDADSVGIDLGLPNVKYVNIATPMTFKQLAFMEQLVERTKKVKENDPIQFPRTDKTGKRYYVDDNMLLITTHGRIAVTDMRLVDPNMRDDYKTKINICCRRAAKIWRKTRAERAVQIIFCDMGVSDKNGFCLYDHIKEYLISLGVTENEIAIAQQWDGSKRETLHQAMRDGEKRIVLASTEVMGVGANVQTRLLALHLIDPSWRPRDMMQKIGRIERPGNSYKRVLVYRYVTQGRDGNVGFDSFMWDKLKMKTKFIQQLFRKGFNSRRIEEDASEDPTFSASEVVALATGDMRLMTYVEIEARITLNKQLISGWRKELDQIIHERSASIFSSCIPALERAITDQHRFNRLDTANGALARQTIGTCTGDNFHVDLVIDNEEQRFTDRRAAAKALWRVADALQADMDERNTVMERNEETGIYEKVRKQRVEALAEPVGTFAGFHLTVQMELSGIAYLVLTHPETGGETDCRMLVDVAQTMTRLENKLGEIITTAAGGEKKLAELQDKLSAAQTAAEQLRTKIQDAATALSTDEAAQQTLAQELGLSDTDEMAVVDFGDGEDD
jgi:N12 class adenine-specific DNA methylase